MSWDYNNVCEGMATALRTVPGLRAHASIPDKIVPPCAIVELGEDQPGMDTFDGSTTVALQVLILVNKAHTGAAQKKLNAYRSTSNNQSVINAVEATPTLPHDGAATTDSVVWKGTSPSATFNIGGIDYYGAELAFEAQTP